MKTLSRTILLVLAIFAGCKSSPPEQAPGEGGAGATSAQASGEGGSGGTSAQASGAGGQQVSGFLGDYSQLRPVPDREGVNAYIDKSADYRRYTKVMFEPVKIIVAPGAAANQVVPPDVLARMSAEMVAAFQRALAPKYQVVAAPGPDVLRVRMAITGVQAAKPESTAMDYLPFKAVYNVARSAAGNAPKVAEMTSEIEVLDPSGKRLVAATATRKGDQKLPQGEAVTWEQLRSISEYWAASFRRRLDELRGE